jgi:hypothetical protein
VGLLYTGIGAVVIFMMIGAVKAAASGGYQGLVKTGIPARGILLSVDRVGVKQPATGIGMNRVRYEKRGMTIDVEIPGKAPYQITTYSYIPTNLSRDVLPGCTVELRVHKRNPQQIAIVGPGVGFAQLMPPAPPS